MTRVEDEVRRRLDALAGPAPRVELAAVLERGERRRRARRAGGWLVAGTVMVAGGVAGAAVLVSGVVPARVVATPAPAPRTPVVTGVPSASVEWPTMPAARKIDLSGNAFARDAGVRSVEVRTSGGPSPRVEVTVVKTSGHTMSRADEPEGGQWLVKVNDQASLMVAPGGAAWAQAAGVGTGLAYAETFELGAVSVVAAFADPGTELAGFMWQDRSGVVRDQSGDQVPSAALVLGGREVWFAQDADLLIACAAEARGTGPYGTQCGTLPSGLTRAGGQRSDGGVQRAFVVVVLPDGATSPAVSASVGCEDTAASLSPGGQTVIGIECTVPSAGEVAFPLVTYVDASGKPASHQP